MRKNLKEIISRRKIRVRLTSLAKKLKFSKVATDSSCTEKANWKLLRKRFIPLNWDGLS